MDKLLTDEEIKLLENIVNNKVIGTDDIINDLDYEIKKLEAKKNIFIDIKSFASDKFLSQLLLVITERIQHDIKGQIVNDVDDIECDIDIEHFYKTFKKIKTTIKDYKKNKAVETTTENDDGDEPAFKPHYTIGTNEEWSDIENDV